MENSPRSGNASVNQEVAVLGGGCFWCLEPAYDNLKGVTDVVSGFSGGHVQNPSYEQVVSGRTGHAEVVKVTFDPAQISYREILEIFFSIHDPTTLNRQGADIGTQYRSAIFYLSEAQKSEAENFIQELTADNVWKNRIVTEVTPFEAFYSAEDYHQEYYARNPGAGYCRVVIAPKLSKFRQKYAEKLKG